MTDSLSAASAEGVLIFLSSLRMFLLADSSFLSELEKCGAFPLASAVSDEKLAAARITSPQTTTLLSSSFQGSSFVIDFQEVDQHVSRCGLLRFHDVKGSTELLKSVVPCPSPDLGNCQSLLLRVSSQPQRPSPLWDPS